MSNEEPFNVDYRVMRVSRTSNMETSRLQTVVAGGTITRNQDTRVVEQASLTLIGDESVGSDLLRIWADITYENGTKESVALGTFLPNSPKRQVKGEQIVSTPITLYGRLRELDDDQFQQPISIAAGSNPMTWIEEVIREAGLELAPHDPMVYRLGSTWSFGVENDERDASKLAAINELLELAGWSSARTDSMGRVVLAPYVPPGKRTPVTIFEEGEHARFLSEMVDERDWFDTANLVKVIYSNQDMTVTGIAVDDDPNSEFSTVTRGRVIAKTYTYSDIPEGKSQAEVSKMADAKAAEMLATTQSVIRRITFTHIYQPVELGDVVTLNYPSGGVTGDFAVRTQKITLAAGLPVEVEARSFERSSTNEHEE